MSDSDDYLPTASSTNSSDTSYPSNREEMEVVSKVQPLEGELRQTQISTKTDKDGLSPARLKQKTPVTEFLLRCVCVLFSVAKSYKDWVDVFVSVAISYYSFALSAGDGSPWSVLKQQITSSAKIVTKTNEKQPIQDEGSSYKEILNEDFGRRKRDFYGWNWLTTAITIR